MKASIAYDIVIIGGGPAGLSAAISILQKKQLSVLIVEGQEIGEERFGENCPPDTILLLKQLGVAADFYKAPHETCPGYASVWGKTTVGYNDFIVNPLGPSWRLDRKAFDLMLAKQAEKLGATIRWATRFLDTSSKQNHFILRLRDQKATTEYTVKANFVIDASGAMARFTKTIGIEKIIKDRLFASIRTAKISSGKISKQVQLEAVKNGWWYNTALPNNSVITMMISEKDTISSLQDQKHKGFEEALISTTFISERLKKLELTEQTYYTWPIYSGILPKIQGANWIAIGDAASSYDPVSAQGIYKGLSDGIHASETVINFFNNEKMSNAFSEMVQKRFKIYEKNRAYVYAIEQRWHEASFWKNRLV